MSAMGSGRRGRVRWERSYVYDAPKRRSGNVHFYRGRLVCAVIAK